jgi:hypothetical protein
VPIHCPNCEGRMRKAYARWGPGFPYTCDSCGEMP